MFCVDVSNNFCFIINLDKNYLGNFSVKKATKIEKKPEENWEEKLPPLIKNHKIAYTIPNSKVFLHRFSVSSAVVGSALSSQILARAQELVPAPMVDLLYDFIVLNKEPHSSNQSVLFIAVALVTLQKQYESWKKHKVIPEFIVPECIATFEILKKYIPKTQTFLYVDIDGASSTLAFFDQYGPLLTLSVPSEIQALSEEIKKAVSYFRSSYNKDVNVALVGGEGGEQIDIGAFGASTTFKTVPADVMFQKELARLGIKVGKSKVLSVEYLNAVALGVLSFENESLNLLKKGASVLVAHKEGTHPPTPQLTISKPAVAPKDDFVGRGQEKKSKKRTVVLLFIFFILLFANGGVLLYKNLDKNVKKGSSIPIPTVFPTPLPTPSPVPLERSALKVQVLNGSGRGGLATTVADLLTEKGYQEIDTGNADSFNYTATVIRIKESKKAFTDLLIQDLEEDYSVSSDSAFLAEENAYDAIVIVGRK